MLNFSRHEWIRFLLKNAKAGLRAEVDPRASIDSAWKICLILEIPATGCFCDVSRVISCFFHFLTNFHNCRHCLEFWEAGPRTEGRYRAGSLLRRKRNLFRSPRVDQ